MAGPDQKKCAAASGASPSADRNIALDAFDAEYNDQTKIGVAPRRRAARPRSMVASGLD